MEVIKVEVLSRDLVKPSSRTPANLRDYKLCLIDQFYPEFHCGIVFFYSSPTQGVVNNTNINTNYDYFSRLKNSLSDTLTDFYPIAGRFKDTTTIDCNDEGACVVEAKINSKLSDFLLSISKPSDDLHRQMVKLVPNFDSATMEFASKCILIAQLTVFECGGFAIAFCLQHRFCDLHSVVIFLNSWSARARGCLSSSSGEIPLPAFVGSSFLPPHDDLPPLPELDNPIENRTTVRLVFEASKISDLKSRFIDEEIGANGINHQKISRLEVVLALILKSAISAARSISLKKTTSAMLYSVNLRQRTTPPLPENSIGNLIWGLPVSIEENDDVSFRQVVSKMKRETTSFIDETVHRIKGDEGKSLVFESMKKQEEILKKTGDLDMYWVSSWCRFPLYDIDFGWGKPVWVSSGIVASKNLIVLEDTKCGNGVQAWVTLDPQVMPIFERDEELLSFATFNPNIV